MKIFSTVLLPSIHEEDIKIVKTTEKIIDSIQETNEFVESTYINKVEESELINNECPEMCLECNSQKKCTKCNSGQNYYPIELSSNPI